MTFIEIKEFFKKISDSYNSRQYQIVIDEVNKFIKLLSPADYQEFSQKSTFHNIFLFLGNSYFFSNKYQEALSAYTTLRDMDPKYSDWWINVANSWVKLGKLEKAIEVYKEGIKINSDSGDLYNNLAWEYYEIGNQQAAIKAMDKAMELDDWQQSGVDLYLKYNKPEKAKPCLIWLIQNEYEDVNSMLTDPDIKEVINHPLIQDAVNNYDQYLFANKTGFVIPDELTQFSEEINKSKTSYIRIQLTKATNLGNTVSKVGGDPFWPKSMPYPKTKKGLPLYLLAQINFAEVPTNQLFPSSGLLQFFLADDEEYGYGMDYKNPTNQNKFRVIYHQANTLKEESLSDFSFIDLPEQSPIETKDPLKMHFCLTEEIAQYYDEFLESQIFYQNTQLQKYFKNLFRENSDHWQELLNKLENKCHKLGGYPSFSQTDPRTRKYSNYELLFQLDTEETNGKGICWGDAGVGNFFIKKDDLKKLDFSNVLYNYDCY